MNIFPYDECPPIIGGNALIYRFVQTVIFPAFIPYHTDAQGNTLNHYVGEKIETTLVARIESDSFYVKWVIGASSKVEDALADGLILKDEVTARRLFPQLVAYKFKGDPSDGSNTHYPGEQG